MVRKIITLFIIFAFSCREDKLKRAETFLKEGKIGEAQFLVESYLKKNEMDSRALFLLGEIYMIKGEYYKAINTFKKMPEKVLYRDSLISDLKYIFKKTKFSAEEIAFSAIELLTLISPEYYDAECYKFVGKKYMEKGKIMEAENIFKKIWEREKDYESLLKFLNLLKEQGNYQKIISLYDSIPKNQFTEEVNTLFGEVFFEMGKIYYENEKLDSSLLFIDKFIEIKKPLVKLADAYYIKGELMLLKGDTLSAVHNFYEVIKLNPAKETGLQQKAKKRIKELSKK